MKLSRAEDGKLYRFGQLVPTDVFGFVKICIFDGTQLVPLQSMEGIAVFNKMIDDLHERKR